MELRTKETVVNFHLMNHISIPQKVTIDPSDIKFLFNLTLQKIEKSPVVINLITPNFGTSIAVEAKEATEDYAVEIVFLSQYGIHVNIDIILNEVMKLRLLQLNFHNPSSKWKMQGNLNPAFLKNELLALQELRRKHSLEVES